MVEGWSLLKPLQQAGGQVWEEPEVGIEVGGEESAQPGRQQAAGRDGNRCSGWRMGTEGNKLMPRKLGPTKAHLLGQCSSP